MQYTLYGSPGSGSAVVEMALRAAGLTYQTVRASEWEPDSAIVELQEINPLGQIPTLIMPGGTVMTECAAILIHLGLEYPHSLLLPTSSSARAMALRGLVFIAANCYPAVSIIDYPARWTSASTKPAHEKIRLGARSQLHRHWEIFADTYGEELARTKDEPGALAFFAVVVSRWCGVRQHLNIKRASFAALLTKLESHSKIAPILSEHTAA